jgi:tRNA-dihydrouridine synthase 3
MKNLRLSFYHRYIPIGVFERGITCQKINWRPPQYAGRDDLETLLSSPKAADWIRISEMFLGKTAPGYAFVAKHKSASY